MKFMCYQELFFAYSFTYTVKHFNALFSLYSLLNNYETILSAFKVLSSEVCLTL